MSAQGLITVEDALSAVLSGVTRLPAETVKLEAAYGRVLARDVAALRTQPPFPASAMDGYAVRAADAAKIGAVLCVIGESAAGHGFIGSVRPGEAVRIFTGAPVPAGADAVLIQERTERSGDTIVTAGPVRMGESIREAGIDFIEGAPCLVAGHRLDGRAIALAAAAGHPRVDVYRAPRVALIATGDELVPPGRPLQPSQIVASNNYALAGIIRSVGGEVLDLGIVPDDRDMIAERLHHAREAGADVIVTLGGASVGDHDLVRHVLTDLGFDLGFWRIAMRPGKPLIHGRWGDIAVLGLPGNPVSSLVCGLVFLRPLLRALQGDANAGTDPTMPAIAAVALKANGDRRDYQRAEITGEQDGLPLVRPFDLQDSSLVRQLALADALLIREIGAPAAPAGQRCRIIRLQTT